MVRLGSIITGMNRLSILLLALVMSVGCMAFGPNHYPPLNFIEEDLIGTWVYTSGENKKSMSIYDRQTSENYENARLILKFYQNHVYEEIFVYQDKKHKVQSTWRISNNKIYTDNGKLPILEVESGRYIPTDASMYFKGDPKFVIQSQDKYKNDLNLCYPTGDPDDWCCYSKTSL